MIQLDLADVMVAGAAEAAITATGLGGFIAAHAVSLRNEQPGSGQPPVGPATRDGFVLSEGAGLVVLEELEHAKKRGARTIYAELLGSASTADAYHITKPEPEGAGPPVRWSWPYVTPASHPDEIDYVNAHGTSTQLGDVAETQGHQARLRRARSQTGRQQHQEHDRPPARRVRARSS